MLFKGYAFLKSITKMHSLLKKSHSYWDGGVRIVNKWRRKNKIHD
ncbi:hypothetical protein bcere0002_37830 [Bacillus cereus ATCC 10876]|nr:hypothetical protein bcere0002_37830 [Bacillus cereus ATCC 10876]